MAGDPRGTLIHRAAATRALDFAAADLTDVRWWRRLNHTLRALADENEYRLAGLYLARTLPYLARSGLAEEGERQVVDAVNRLVDEASDILKPWARDADRAGKRTALAGMEAAWIRAWGDYGDPRVAAAIDEAVAELRRGPAPPPEPPARRRKPRR